MRAAALDAPQAPPMPQPAAVNRRMDEWVPLKNFNLDTVIPPLVEPDGDGGRCGAVWQGV